METVTTEAHDDIIMIVSEAPGRRRLGALNFKFKLKLKSRSWLPRRPISRAAPPAAAATRDSEALGT